MQNPIIPTKPGSAPVAHVASEPITHLDGVLPIGAELAFSSNPKQGNRRNPKRSEPSQSKASDIGEHIIDDYA